MSLSLTQSRTDATGYPAHAPYAAIHVGAAAPKLPQALVDQLGKPGRMFIPVGEGSQEILLVDRGEDGEVGKKRLMGVLVSSRCVFRVWRLMRRLVCAADRSGNATGTVNACGLVFVSCLYFYSHVPLCDARIQQFLTPIQTR
jgi:hypothetical protein